MPLEDLQRQFMDALWSDSDAIQLYVREKDHRSAHEQFSVYKGSVIANMVAALGDIYPRVKRALGAEFFDAMARRYVRQYQSHSPSLDDYGREFADFCRHFKPLQDYAYIVDLAILDGAWHAAFHSLDVAPVTTEELARLGEQAMHSALVLHPSGRIIRSDYPLYQLWMLNDDDTQNRVDETVSLDQECEHVLVWRPELQVKVMRLNEHELAFLMAMIQATSVGQAFEFLLESSPFFRDTPENLSVYFAHFLAEGAFCQSDAK